MIKCSCKDPLCGNYITTDPVSHMIFLTKDNPKGSIGERENSMYLDPNTIVELIGELKSMLDNYVLDGFK